MLVWNFCGGWNPAMVQAAALYYGVDDLEVLLDLLLAMRDCFSTHQAAQREAEKLQQRR